MATTPSPGVDRAAGATVDGGEAGVGGEACAAGETAGVTDLGEGSGAGPGPEPTQGHQDGGERVLQEHLFDLFLQLGPAGVDPVEVTGEVGDDLPHARSAGSVTVWDSSACDTRSASFTAIRGDRRAMVCRILALPA